MRLIYNRLIVPIMLVVSSFLLFSCLKTSESTLERARKEGVLRIGYANDIPFGYKTADGDLTGEAPEIARKILAEMGVPEIQGVFTEFGSLIPALKAGRFDMIAAGMFILPERSREIAFSEPTYSIGQSFLVKAGNPLKLNSYEDVAENPDAILCVMEGAVEAGYALAIGIPESRIFTVPNTTAGLEAVREGRADALALTSLSIQKLVINANDQTIEQAYPFKDPLINGKKIRGYGAFGFRKQDKDLLEEFNKHLKLFIGTNEHLDIMKTFGFVELPGEVTTEDLLKEE